MNAYLLNEICGIGTADVDKLDSLYEEACSFTTDFSLEGLTGGDLFSELVSTINREVIDFIKRESEYWKIKSERIRSFIEDGEDEFSEWADSHSDCNFICSHHGFEYCVNYDGTSTNWRSLLVEVLQEKFGKTFGVDW